MHTYTPTHIHTYTSTHIHTYMHTYIHTYLHTYILFFIHTYLKNSNDGRKSADTVAGSILYRTFHFKLLFFFLK